MALLPGAHAVYLTPPRPIVSDPHDHRMTLAHVSLDAASHTPVAAVIDTDTCSCCPTAVAMAAAGPIAAYRDHEPDDIRDIAVVRFVDGRWTSPRPVHRDGWRIDGCPTNGPSISASGSRVALAWFTGANDRPAVKVAFSQDSGETFGSPIDVDGRGAVGRPTALLLADGSAVVAWLASSGDGSGGGELRVRRIRGDGTTGAVVVAGAATR